MPVEPSTPVVLAVSKDGLDQFLTELVSFEQFHFSEDNQDFIDFALAQRLDELYSRLLSLTDRLHIKRDVGVMDSFREGYGEEKRRRVEGKDLPGLVEALEGEVEGTTADVWKLLDEMDQARKSMEALERAELTLRSFSRLSLSLEALVSMRRFYVELFIAGRGDLAEIARSLEGRAEIYSEPIDERNALCAVVSARENQDLVERTLRAFEVSYLRIPEGYPSVPSEAYRRIAEEMEAARKRVEEMDSRIGALARERYRRIAEEMEAAEMLRSQATRMKSYNLKRVAIVRGFVPASALEEFRERFRGYLVYVEQPRGDEPVSFRNNRYSANFEPITLNQGMPSRMEVDPTPMISIVFPMFFGMMFGDIGHGIVLMVLGILLRIRGYESLRKWGNMIMAFGVGAVAMGAMDGEFFGIHIYRSGMSIAGVTFPIIPDIIQYPSAVTLIFRIALIVGIAHLLSAFTISSYQEGKAHGLKHALREKIPVYVFFISGIIWGYTFIANGYNFNAIGTTLSGQASSVAILAASAAMIFNSAAKAGFMGGFIEWFIHLIETISNIISYVRLGVLLMVHMALLYIADMFLPVGGVIGYSGWFMINIGIVMLEGLMVYIQDIRLHAYEWFTKFFEGSGKPFLPLAMRGKRIELAIAG